MSYLALAIAIQVIYLSVLTVWLHREIDRMSKKLDNAINWLGD